MAKKVIPIAGDESVEIALAIMMIAAISITIADAKRRSLSFFMKLSVCD